MGEEPQKVEMVLVPTVRTAREVGPDPLLAAVITEDVRRNFKLNMYLCIIVTIINVCVLFTRWFVLHDTLFSVDSIYVNEEWQGLGSLTLAQCYLHWEFDICDSMQRIHTAGICFIVLWCLGLVLQIHNIANLVLTLRAQNSKWCKYDFLHIVSPVLHVLACLVWVIISKILWRPEFDLSLGLILAGFSVALMVVLAKHYHMHKGEMDNQDVYTNILEEPN